MALFSCGAGKGKASSILGATLASPAFCSEDCFALLSQRQSLLANQAVLETQFSFHSSLSSFFPLHAKAFLLRHANR